MFQLSEEEAKSLRSQIVTLEKGRGTAVMTIAAVAMLLT
jgi:hypothetical protein